MLDVNLNKTKTLGSGDNSDNIYFAAKEPKKTASILLDRAASFYNTLRANAYLEKLQRMWRAYHGAYSSYSGLEHGINFSGEQGELVQFPVNHFRNLAQHIYVMITSNRPIMEARAVNTDYKSSAQTILANGILDYYMREKRLEDCIKKAAEMSVVLGSGFIKMEWNATAGEAYDIDPDTGEFSYEGELEFSNLSPFDVVVDGTKENWDNEWILVRTFKNRYNLMAKYPEFADRIKGIPSKSQSMVYRLAVFSNDETDDIAVYEFYHKRTESLQDGRYMLFLDSDIVLLDTKLPYRTIPIFRIAAGEIMGTPYAYSPMFDVFPVQECLNSTYSTIMTNQNAFGVQNVFIPRGSDIALSSIEGGMNIIEGDSPPQAVNLTQTPGEIFKFLEILIQTAETLSGVNSVARGNPEASLKSGAALALVQSMALQFISGLQQSYVKLVEDVGTSLIQILKDFANTPKVITLVGKNNRTLLKEFTGEKISSINRVVVDIGNPLSRTVAGRVQMAEQMLQMNLIKTPQEYLQVMDTGRLEHMYQGDQQEMLLIKLENERLTEGESPIVSPIDQHKLHIMEHRGVIADPESRNNAELVRETMDHIEKHLNFLRTTDPDLLALIGEQALAPLPPAQPPQGPEQGPPQGGPPSMGSLKHSPMGPVMTEPQGGPALGGQKIINPNLPGGEQSLPNIPKVNGQLLTNPAAQQAAMGNVRQ